MAKTLGLRETQIEDLARLLHTLETERAQAAVDDKRTLSAFADALVGEAFDPARAQEGVNVRAKSSEVLRAAVLKTLEATHALLDKEQRKQLAYMLRTGALSI